MSDQEREKIEAAYKAWDEGFPGLTLYDDDVVFEAGYRAALAAREEPHSVDLESLAATIYRDGVST